MTKSYCDFCKEEMDYDDSIGVKIARNGVGKTANFYYYSICNDCSNKLWGKIQELVAI